MHLHYVSGLTVFEPFASKNRTRFCHAKHKITHFILIPLENIVFFVVGKRIIIVKNQFGGAAVEQMTKKYIRYTDTRIYAICYHRIRTAYINLNFQGNRKLIVYR